MLKRSSRHVLGLVVAILIASIAAAQPVPAAAPANGTLFGVVSACQFCVDSVDQLDPASGTETPFATIPGLSVGSLVADPAQHLLYAAGFYVVGGGKGGGGDGFTKMVTIDSRTGSVAISPDISVNPLDMALDPANHTLLALVYTYSVSTYSASVVRLDPATWTATAVAPVPDNARGLTYDPASHTLYTETPGPPGILYTTDGLIAINTQTGAVSAATTLNPGVFNLVFDTSSRALYGETDSFPSRFVQVNPSTGAETPIGTFTFSNISAFAATIDSGTHTVFFVETDIVLGGVRATWIATVNDQTGASTVSPQTAGAVGSIAFQSPLITPESIQSDVRAALASGAIDNAGVANSLLAKLSAAADARSRGQCGTAANSYSSLINELGAQSGKHVAAATTAQLAAEAQFLVANCQ